MSSVRLALAACPRDPAVWLLNLDTGESLPVPTPLDNGGAFDHGLGRRGWVAAQVEYQVGGYADGGDLSRPVLLPQAWQMYPAATDDLVLLAPYFGRSSAPGEPERVVVAGRDGGVHRSMVLPWDVDARLAGEIAAGLVTWAGIAGWDGQIYPLPGDRTGDPYTDPGPVAVLAGRVIVFEGVDYLETLDVESGTRNRVAIPERRRRWPGPADPRFTPRRSYNAAGTWVVAGTGGIEDTEDCVVAGANGDIRWLPGLPQAASLWIGDKLVRWNYDDGRPRRVRPRHGPVFPGRCRPDAP